MDLKFHEAANIMPLVEGPDLEVLAEDIAENGLQLPIELYEGKILDGRSRYRACLLKGIEPDIVEVDPVAQGYADAIAYVLSMNCFRRHLDTSQRAMVAARLKKHYAKLAKERQVAGQKAGGKKRHGDSSMVENLPPSSKARDQAGQSTQVSGKSVDHAAKVLEKGTKSLIRAVEQGVFTVSRAAQLADLPKDEQNEIVAAENPKAAAKQKLNPEPTGNGQPRIKKPKRTAKLSLRGLWAQQAYADKIPQADVVVQMGFASEPIMRRCRQVATSERQDLIDAMDEEVLAVSSAWNLLKKDKTEAAKAIEALRLKEAKKRHRAASSKGKTKPQRLLGLLERTWVDWRGFNSGKPANSQWIPKQADKLGEIRQLAQQVRSAVNTVLDPIDKEIEKCTARTTVRSDS